MCRGVLGPIFQQIIDKVKPKKEIEMIRRNIIINKVKEKSLSVSFVIDISIDFVVDVLSMILA